MNQEQKQMLREQLALANEEIANIEKLKGREGYTTATERYQVLAELQGLKKFYEVALRGAPKDLKKLRRLHEQINEAAQHALDQLMEDDHTFHLQDDEHRIVNISSKGANQVFLPGDGLGEQVRQMGENIKQEYKLREVIIENWLYLTKGRKVHETHGLGLQATTDRRAPHQQLFLEGTSD